MGSRGYMLDIFSRVIYVRGRGDVGEYFERIYGGCLVDGDREINNLWCRGKDCTV